MTTFQTNCVDSLDLLCCRVERAGRIQFWNVEPLKQSIIVHPNPIGFVHPELRVIIVALCN